MSVKSVKIKVDKGPILVINTLFDFVLDQTVHFLFY